MSGLLDLLVPIDIALQASLFFSPLAPDPARRVVGIYRADPFAEPPVLGLEPLDRFLAIKAFVRL